MGKKQQDDFVTPNEMLMEVMMRLAFYETVLENIADVMGPEQIGYVPFSDLEPKRLQIFKRKARKNLDRLLVPMISFMMPVAPTVIVEEAKPPVEEKKTQELPPETIIEEELSPENVDATLHENPEFYGEITAILGKI